MKRLVSSPEGNFEIELTAEEVAQRQAEENAWNAGAFDRAIKELRNTRNKMLSDSDFYVIKAKENNEEVPTNIKTYRQQLRDLTEGLTTVEQVNNILINKLYPIKLEGIIEINLTAEEIAQEQANKQSALNKLKALGLNDAEIKAIIGN